jgi:hypothetical protein
VAIGQQMAVGLSGLGHASATMSAGPPPMPGANYYVGVNGVQSGPFDMATLQRKVAEGSLPRSALVWKPGMAEWAAAESVAEVNTLFSSAPPPMPKG